MSWGLIHTFFIFFLDIFVITIYVIKINQGAKNRIDYLKIQSINTVVNTKNKQKL